MYRVIFLLFQIPIPTFEHRLAISILIWLRQYQMNNQANISLLWLRSWQQVIALWSIVCLFSCYYLEALFPVTDQVVTWYGLLVCHIMCFIYNTSGAKPPHYGGKNLFLKCGCGWSKHAIRHGRWCSRAIARRWPSVHVWLYFRHTTRWNPVRTHKCLQCMLFDWWWRVNFCDTLVKLTPPPP